MPLEDQPLCQCCAGSVIVEHKTPSRFARGYCQGGLLVGVLVILFSCVLEMPVELVMIAWSLTIPMTKEL